MDCSVTAPSPKIIASHMTIRELALRTRFELAMNTIPKVVTHNYDPEGAFLANLCDLPMADAPR